MLTTAIAALAFGFAGPQTPLHCPATLEDITGAPAITMEYGGTLFGTCCGGCDTPFLKDPKSLIAKAVKANKTIGAFEYDPISGAKIDSKKAAEYSDYKAIRYFFTSADEKKTFDATPAKFVGEVKSESTSCPVSKMAMGGKSAAYADYEGVRYYFCCGDCIKEFKADPAKFAASATASVKPLAAVTVKK